MLEDSDKCLWGMTMLEKTLYLNPTEIMGVLVVELLRRFWKVTSIRRNVGNIACVTERWQNTRCQVRINKINV